MILLRIPNLREKLHMLLKDLDAECRGMRRIFLKRKYAVHRPDINDLDTAITCPDDDSRSVFRK